MTGPDSGVDDDRTTKLQRGRWSADIGSASETGRFMHRLIKDVDRLEDEIEKAREEQDRVLALCQEYSSSMGNDLDVETRLWRIFDLCTQALERSRD